MEITDNCHICSVVFLNIINVNFCNLALKLKCLIFCTYRQSFDDSFMHYVYYLSLEKYHITNMSDFMIASTDKWLQQYWDHTLCYAVSLHVHTYYSVSSIEICWDLFSGLKICHIVSRTSDSIGIVTAHQWYCISLRFKLVRVTKLRGEKLFARFENQVIRYYPAKRSFESVYKSYSLRRLTM